MLKLTAEQCKFRELNHIYRIIYVNAYTVCAPSDDDVNRIYCSIVFVTEPTNSKCFDGQGIQLGLLSFQWILAKLDSKWQLNGELGAGSWVINDLSIAGISPIWQKGGGEGTVCIYRSVVEKPQGTSQEMTLSVNVIQTHLLCHLLWSPGEQRLSSQLRSG